MTATAEPRVRTARAERPDRLDRESGERTTRAPGSGPGRGVRGGGDPPDLGALVAGVRGLPGEPLPEETRREAEARTGLDLSATRVHRTAEAAGYAEALGARAFTFDRDIVVGRGADAATLAHEALHAAQFVRHGAPAVPVGIADPAHAAHAQASGSAPGPAAGVASPGGLVQPQDLMEAIAPKKQRPPATTWHGDLYRAVVGSETGAALYSVLPEDAKHAIQAAGAAQAFDEAFFRAVIAGLTKADADALEKEFTPPTARLAFEAGLYGGVAVGVVKDLYSNLEGLYEIVKLGVEYSPLGMTARTLADIAKLGYDPQLFAEEKQAEAAHAQAVIDTVIAFARHIAADPTYLVGKGEEMGAACGEHASEWFHGDFLRQSPLQKGYTVGQGLGMVATEVALLFLGPEEWIAKGAIAVGQAAKATRFGKLVIELLSTFPEVARLLRLRTEVNEASEALRATRTLREAGEKGTAKVAEGEKGLAVAGDVSRPKIGEPHAPAPKGGEPKLAEPHAVGPAPLKPRTPEPKAVKPKPAKAGEHKPLVSHPPETQVPSINKSVTAAPGPKSPRDPAQGTSLKSLAPAERTRVEGLRTAAEAAAAEIRGSGVRNASGLPHGWDHGKHPFGPKSRWQVGDPVDMPSGSGVYPGWGTIRRRVWKTKAVDERAARTAGLSQLDGKGSFLDPIKEATAEELDAVAKTGRMPRRLRAEIEHERIPQRVGQLLRDAGLEGNEARKVSKLGDATNLLPTNVEYHAISDNEAHLFPGANRNPGLPGALDDRSTFPLGSASNEEIGAMIDALDSQGVKLGNTEDGLTLRKILNVEKERRGASARWLVP